MLFTPANWLKIMLTMLTKIQQAVKKMWIRQIPPSALQLVYTDSDGKLQLNERVVQSCFLHKKVSKYPLYLICGTGERRKGKSTLLNYILRALHCLERGQPVSLEQDDEPLTGFEWRGGIDSVTKGIWIWNKPFILERNGEKMAVFVLDTEGSLDIEGDRETCLKLSALSMLLSSHLIINVNATLNTTELDYLEMFVNWSKLMRDSSLPQHLQHLDVLVRDWKDPDHCGREEVHVFLQHEHEKLTMREDSKYNLVMDTPSVSCFLLPHLGNKFLEPSQGTLADMDENFRHHLTTYISNLVEGIWPHQKADINGEKITCGHVGKELKDLVSILQREECSFTSFSQMSDFPINWKQLKTLLQAYQKYLDQQSPDDVSALEIFGVRPSEMRSRVSRKAIQFQEKYKLSLRGDNAAGKEMLMEEMKSQLTEKQERFCAKYSQRFTMCTMSIGSAIGGTALGMVGPVAGEVGFFGQHNHSSGQRDRRS
ncbi:RING finger protein 112-like [Aquarana catesbeiana]|uniref:RING finger protein 112-like n=1 Tax=Aquarana catesbeiana TaxID=8400 RepID=UPI003CC9C0A2